MSEDLKSLFSHQSSPEHQVQATLESLITDPMFGDDGERLRNLPLFLRQKDLAHILFLAEIYRLILDVPGYVAEFGLMWGRNLNLLHCLRECYEPYNHTRRLLGFDTFSGFVGSSSKDALEGAPAGLYAAGAYSVPDGYEEKLADVLRAQESISHLSHLRRFDLVKGDITKTLPEYLGKNPHTILALCYMDLDLYEPTRAVLQAIKPHLVRGSVLVFDEVLSPDYPGETAAINEVFGLGRISLRRSSLSGWKTYLVVG